MSILAYCEHNARRPAARGPFDHVGIAGDVVELDAYLVEEGEAAAETIRRHFEAEQRRLPDLLP